MSYSAEISRSNPTLFVFLLDQSGSMADYFGSGELQQRKSDALADVANRTIHDLVIRCTKSEEIRDYYEVAVLGYGASTTSAVGSTLPAGSSIMKISQLADRPVRLEDRAKKVSDGAGGLVEQRVKFPIWVESVAGNGTPMCAALQSASDLVRGWLGDHPACFPPVLLHITDGESTDGDPTALAKSIGSLRSTDGEVLIFNCHLSSQRAPSILFPVGPETLPNEFAKLLFEMSSIIPEPFRNSAAQSGLSLATGARGFVFNADAAALVQFFDIGTRPANLR